MAEDGSFNAEPSKRRKTATDAAIVLDQRTTSEKMMAEPTKFSMTRRKPSSVANTRKEKRKSKGQRVRKDNKGTKPLPSALGVAKVASSIYE